MLRFARHDRWRGMTEKGCRPEGSARGVPRRLRASERQKEKRASERQKEKRAWEDKKKVEVLTKHSLPILLKSKIRFILIV
jgi:hypothetical protein